MTNVRWWIVGMAFVGMTINYLDRTALGVAAPWIAKDLHLAPKAVGSALSAFFIAYALSLIPFGAFVDRAGPRRAYPLGMVWWSVFSALTALANGLGWLFGIRFLLGIGEASSMPTNAKVTATWFPRAERARASSIWDAGARVGITLAFPLVGGLIAFAGWRAAFVATGVIGIVWAVVWYALYRDPDQSRASAAELAHIRAGAVPEPTGRVSIAQLFRYRTVWGMMIGFFCSNIVNYFFVTWFPSYLVSVRHFSLTSVATVGMIPPLCGIAGGLLAGVVADRLLRAGWSVTAARKTCLVGSLIVASVIALAVIAPTTPMAIALFSLANAAIAFNGASINGLAPEVAPTRASVGTLQGIQTFGGNLAGIVTAFATGVMVEITSGSFVIPVAVAGCFALLGALTYLVVVGKIEPLGGRGVVVGAVAST
jgi:ACS family D-galactonate transporter-like MFS transporter